MTSATILKGRPIEVLPQVTIWEYIENKMKKYGSKVAQVSFVIYYAFLCIYGIACKGFAKACFKYYFIFNHAHFHIRIQKLRVAHIVKTVTRCHSDTLTYQKTRVRCNTAVIQKFHI